MKMNRFRVARTYAHMCSSARASALLQHPRCYNLDRLTSDFHLWTPVCEIDHVSRINGRIFTHVDRPARG
jgi:hypothetical protein